MPHARGDEPRVALDQSIKLNRMPHARGDEPKTSPTVTPVCWYAPRTWG